MQPRITLGCMQYAEHRWVTGGCRLRCLTSIAQSIWVLIHSITGGLLKHMQGFRSNHAMHMQSKSQQCYTTKREWPQQVPAWNKKIVLLAKPLEQEDCSAGKTPALVS